MNLIFIIVTILNTISCFSLQNNFNNLNKHKINNQNINKQNINNLNLKSMQFNLNKDSLWLSYPLKYTSFKDFSYKIPSTHRLAKCKIFEEDTLDYRLFFNFFEVKTQFFSGNRLEIVTIANNILNNKPSFIILDCYTNVMSWDPVDGIQKSNCKIKTKNTNTRYDINLDLKDECDNKINNIFKLKSLKTKIRKSVLKEFSINPNYICYFKNHTKGYNLLFNENQINKKVILLKDIKLNHNIYLKYIKELEHAFIYPQEMNFKVLF